MVIFFEPLSTPRLSKKMADAVKKALPQAITKIVILGIQHDGYSCGYNSVFWQIITQKLLDNKCVPLEIESLPAPPHGWERIILKLMNLEDRYTYEDPRDIGLQSDFNESLNNGIFLENAFNQRIAAYIRDQLLKAA